MVKRPESMGEYLALSEEKKLELMQQESLHPSADLLVEWIKKIQLVNRRSEHFNSVIETFCTEALRQV